MRTGSVLWERRAQVPAVLALEDHGWRWGDGFFHTSGGYYRAVGDVHPGADRVLVETCRQVVDGELRRVSAGRLPDGEPAERRLPSVWVPAYGRCFQLLDLADVVDTRRGEDVVARLLAEPPRDPSAAQLADTLRDLVAMGVPTARLGVQGSFARGTGKPTSDFDIDVFDPEYGALLRRALAAACADSSSPWRREWPPRERSIIDGLRQTALADWTDAESELFFTDERRGAYSYLRAGRSVSVFYHSTPRDTPAPALVVADPDPEPVRTYIARVRMDERTQGHREDPAFVELDPAVCTETGERLTGALLTSWARAVWYCVDGDEITFRAQRVRLASGRPYLVLPDWGTQWPVRFGRRA